MNSMKVIYIGKFMPFNKEGIEYDNIFALTLPKSII